MASDDFDVIAYKVLAYVMACARADVVPSIAKAKEVAGCGKADRAMVIGSMLDDGLTRLRVENLCCRWHKKARH